MTLHKHKVDGRHIVEDGGKLFRVPDGWQIAPGDDQDTQVCGAHAWESNCLVFANGDFCGTALHPSMAGLMCFILLRLRKIKFSDASAQGKNIPAATVSNGRDRR
jgi:hypothetical protein